LQQQQQLQLQELHHQLQSLMPLEQRRQTLKRDSSFVGEVSTSSTTESSDASVCVILQCSTVQLHYSIDI